MREVSVCIVVGVGQLLWRGTGIEPQEWGLRVAATKTSYLTCRGQSLSPHSLIKREWRCTAAFRITGSTRVPCHINAVWMYGGALAQHRWRWPGCWALHMEGMFLPSRMLDGCAESASHLHCPQLCSAFLCEECCVRSRGHLQVSVFEKFCIWDSVRMGPRTIFLYFFNSV